ncbi:MAG TPA: phosphoglucosamine mutase, partial [Planctomycetota bacterium]|nr:phosphoglucosamine mutase [Planctomycetota bacterium]
LAGRAYLRRSILPKRTVVATVMSNIGLEKALAADGLSLLRTPVGDRHVYLALCEQGHPFGGEQSGHLIFLDSLPTGDGILAALRLCDVLESDELDLAAEARIMKRYPQILRNLRVREKRPLDSLPRVVESIASAEGRLGENGRVLVRYSGTEPLLRIMIEGPDETSVHELADSIARAVANDLDVLP